MLWPSHLKYAGSAKNASPAAAVEIVCGIAAHVDEEKCVACGKCARACPAAVIEIVERGGVERGSAL